MYRQVKMVLLDIRHLVIDSAQSALPHAHAEGQLFMVQSGLITANTQTGHWVMPPGCLGWIPPFTAHSASNQGKYVGPVYILMKHGVISLCRQPLPLFVSRHC